MSDENFAKIQRECDAVVHCAALVNSRLSLLQLLPSNAIATKLGPSYSCVSLFLMVQKRSCIELCSLKPTRFVYVSSAGVLYPFAARGEVRGKEKEPKKKKC